MTMITRDFVGGYFLTDPARPKVLRGLEYLQATPCGIAGDKSFTYIKFSPNLYDDTKGEFQESFDLSGIGADEIAQNPLFQAAFTGHEINLAEVASQFAPSAVSRVSAELEAGVSLEYAITKHIARLLPEYCGETFNECVAFRPELIQVTVDPESGLECVNISRCSLE